MEREKEISTPHGYNLNRYFNSSGDSPGGLTDLGLVGWLIHLCILAIL